MAATSFKTPEAVNAADQVTLDKYFGEFDMKVFSFLNLTVLFALPNINRADAILRKSDN